MHFCRRSTFFLDMEDIISKQCLSLEEDLRAFQQLGECMIFKKTPRKDGYAYVTLRLPQPDGDIKKTSTSAHRAALLLHLFKEGKVATLQVDKTLECSHLCHNKMCINVKHLVLENKNENLSRKVCLRRKACQGHAPACLL